MTSDRPALPAAPPISRLPARTDPDATPQVGCPAMLLVWLAIAVPGLGVLGGAIVLCVSARGGPYTPVTTAILAIIACLPVPAMAALLRVRDEKQFRTASLTCAGATLLFAVLALMFAVGFLYLPSVVLLVLAWCATYGPARIRRNAAAIAGIALVGLLAYCVGSWLSAALRS